MPKRDKGFRKLEKELDQMQKNAEKAAETTNITYDDLFKESFMREYTNFTSIDELFEAGGFHVESNEDLESLNKAALDQHVQETTLFSSYREMEQKAYLKYLSKEIGF